MNFLIISLILSLSLISYARNNHWDRENRDSGYADGYRNGSATDSYRGTNRRGASRNRNHRNQNRRARSAHNRNQEPNQTGKLKGGENRGAIHKHPKQKQILNVSGMMSFGTKTCKDSSWNTVCVEMMACLENLSECPEDKRIKVLVPVSQERIAIANNSDSSVWDSKQNPNRDTSGQSNRQNEQKYWEEQTRDDKNAYWQIDPKKPPGVSIDYEQGDRKTPPGISIDYRNDKNVTGAWQSVQNDMRKSTRGR